MSIERDCETCCGDGELTGDGVNSLEHLIRTTTRIRGIYLAIANAIPLIHRYRAEDCVAGEDWRSDPRIIACRQQVSAYRREIRDLRKTLRVERGHFAWCLPCKGTGLSSIECAGCGVDVTMTTINDDARECAGVVVHKDCDCSAWPHTWSGVSVFEQTSEGASR